MRNHICKADWAKVEEALMLAQIPYRVSFDSHLNEITDNANIYYDVQIQIEPFYYQEKRGIND